MTITTENHVFSRLWHQAAENVFNRPVERATNSQGSRAIKFKTDGMHKVLIFEVERRPGFEVRLCGFQHVPGVVSDGGIVKFSGPVETSSLGQLINQIDRWALSFETIFGEVVSDVVDAPTRPALGEEPAHANAPMASNEMAATEENGQAAKNDREDAPHPQT